MSDPFEQVSIEPAIEAEVLTEAPAEQTSAEQPTEEVAAAASVTNAELIPAEQPTEEVAAAASVTNAELFPADQTLIEQPVTPSTTEDAPIVAPKEAVESAEVATSSGHYIVLEGHGLLDVQINGVLTQFPKGVEICVDDSIYFAVKAYIKEERD